jgi:hypothetical protein
MSKLRNLLVLLPIVLIISSCTSQPALPTVEEATESVIAKEREALDQWSAGNPGGFTVNMAMDVTYMDDIGAHSRLDGFEEVQNYLSSLDGMIPPHSYEVQDPKVQVGLPLPRWGLEGSACTLVPCQGATRCRRGRN